MLNALLSASGTALCVIFPLLLTLKVLNGIQYEVSSPSTTSQMQYLLNYWICYIAVRFIQYNLVLKTVSQLGIGSGVEAVFLILKIWLFYGHGCLFINYYYARHLALGLLGKNWSSFDKFETNVWEPFVRIMIVKNSIVIFLINAVNATLGHIQAINRVLSEVSYFYLSIPTDQSFLMYSLDYICYIDSPTNLNSFIVRTKECIDSYFGLLNIGSQINSTPIRKVANDKENIHFQSFRSNKRQSSNTPTRCMSPRNISGGHTPEKYKIRYVYSEPSSHITTPNSHINVKSQVSPSRDNDLPFPLLHVEKRHSPPVLQPSHGRTRSIPSKTSSRNSSNYSSDVPYPVSGVNNTF